MLEISRETRAVNSIGDLNGALDDMPNYCVTIGMYEIANARKIRLGCFRVMLLFLTIIYLVMARVCRHI